MTAQKPPWEIWNEMQGIFAEVQEEQEGRFREEASWFGLELEQLWRYFQRTNPECVVKELHDAEELPAWLDLQHLEKEDPYNVALVMLALYSPKPSDPKEPYVARS